MRFSSFASASVLLASVLLGPSARAADRLAIDEASYSAPEGCETAESFASRLRSSTPTPPPYVIRVTATADGFEGRARWVERGASTTSERVFVSPSCDDVTRGLALAVGLGSAPDPVDTEARPSLLGPAFEPPARDAGPEKAKNERRHDLLITGGLSMFADGKGLLGMSLEEKVVYRRGVLGLGAIAEQSTRLFDYQSYSFAPMVGAFVPGPKWLRAGILGTAGVRVYQNADGIGWFGGCPCVDGVLAYTGARALIGFDVWYLHVGAHAFADTDIGTVTRSVKNDQGKMETLSAGTFRVGGGLALGPRFDL